MWTQQTCCCYDIVTFSLGVYGGALEELTVFTLLDSSAPNTHLSAQILMEILKKKESQFGSARAMKVLYVDLDIVQLSDSFILILSLSLVFALLSRCHWYQPSSLAVIGICPPLSLSLVFALLISSVSSSWCSTVKLFFHHDD